MDADDEEIARNWALVATPLGEPWSGRARYGAAVFLYNLGEMEPEVLEVYRLCSRLDAEDPLPIIRDRGIGRDWLEKLRRRGARDADQGRQGADA